MQLGIPKRTILGRSRIHGFGLYAGEKIKRHDFVGEYSGEIVLEEERVRRGEVYEIQKMSYLFILTADQEIDSHHVGNKMRFVNHASQTGRNGACNLRPEIVMCNMTPRIGMYATRDIEIGEELFFNYGDHYMSLLKDTVAADDAKDGDKEKPKRKGGRKKKIVRRRKKLADFAEPEYEDLDIVEKGEGTVGSKKVTPRYKPKAKREMASKSVSVATAGDDDEGEEVADSEVEDQVGDEEEDEVEETPIKSRRGGKRKTIVEEVEESDFEAEETPRRVSGRAAKKRRTVEEVDDDEDSEVDDPGKKVYVAPIVNGKKKRGRPKKNFFDGDD
ncbi:Histone-lysine N-methyltransferase-like protein 3 [Elsinoe fawcettii]|nr:Histone-lysine N-methyltransferase-like protein 3 [Elsinoe fawcettii]